MFDSSNILVGLETGTSKICAVVGELTKSGALNIIGIGQARSRGVRKGEVVDVALAEEDIRNAVVEAEQMADVEIRSVFLGVTGSHLQGFNNRGVHTVISVDHEITEDDVQDVIKNAKAINLPSGNALIHAVRQHFRVDGHEGVVNPVGMLGTRVELDMHVVHGDGNRLQNPVRVVQNLQLQVETVVFNGLASCLALLTNEQKELGSLVIDLGGGTTEYVVCTNGIIKHSGVLALGGDHITNDLAVGLKLPLQRAEQLKISHGQAVLDESAKGQTIVLPGEVGLPERKINLEHLRQIMSLRIEEILQIIARELEKAGLMQYLRAGIFICGGGARIPHIQTLAERIFRLPVVLGKAAAFSSIKSSLDQPEFATAMGLVKFASLQFKQRTSQVTLAQGLRNRLVNIFRRESP